MKPEEASPTSRVLESVLLTLDVDWAPDAIIRAIAEDLVSRRVKATWFVTHETPALEILRRHRDLFELGIHPNYLPGSTHGATAEQVLGHCMRIVPEATCVRSHSLVQSTPLLEALLEQTPVRVDVTTYLPGVPGLKPFLYEWKGQGLWRVPYFWEDSFEVQDPHSRWNRKPWLHPQPGLKVLNFHPLLVYLNLREARRYQELKKAVPRFPEASGSDLAPFTASGQGPGALFREVVKVLGESRRSFLIRDLVPGTSQP